MTDWYRLTAEETLKSLGTDPSRGLSGDEAEKRIARFGKNELQEKAGQTVWEMLFSQFKEFLVLLLIGAAVISILLGEITDALVIFLVVIINAILGVIQEFKAEKSLAALKTLSAPTAKVVREGRIFQLPAGDLVPGDLILLDAGDFIPADARLLEAVNLKVDESALTGESVPVEKDAAFTVDGEAPLAERKNLVFMGTVSTFGRARAVVTTTGMETEIGRIAGLIQEAEAERTPLQKKLTEFGQELGVLALILCAIIFFLGILRGNRLFEMFFTSVSLAVAVIPEGLPAIVTIVLALGVQRMAGQKAIIRKLPAVETLGSATVICSDKTGTLTQNAMTVRRIAIGESLYEVTGEGYELEGDFLRKGAKVPVEEDPYLSLILKIGLLCNDASFFTEDGKRRLVGDPTEGALVVAAEKGGFDRQRFAKEFPREKELPFDSVRKRMSTVNRGPLPSGVPGLPEEGFWLLVKGAPDTVLEKCTRWLGKDGPSELTPEKKEEFLRVNREMAGEALRVLGFALRPFNPEEDFTVEAAEQDLIFIGFMGMIDPPRSEAREAIKVCRKAGIKVKMITGDHRDTALAIAKELGLAAGENQIMTGGELDKLSQEELGNAVKEVTVFARVSPEHKVRIVDALKKNGEIVAMTGDGVNDAPALKKADIGAAMGIAGTDVAKEAAEMVLADDNFVTIVQAVKEGRIIFENIKKAIYFLLSCNAGEIFTILTAILLGWPVPLYPIQILWVNLVTDSLPALALGVDPPEDEVMQKKPRDPGEGIFAYGMKRTLVFYGVFIAFVTLAAFNIGAKESIMKGQTMAFATLGLSQLAHVFNFRSLSNSILTRGFLGNKPLLLGILVSAVMQLAVLFTPFLMEIFKVQRLAPSEILEISGLVLSPLLFGELWKAVWIRKKQK